MADIRDVRFLSRSELQAVEAVGVHKLVERAGGVEEREALVTEQS